MSNAHQTIHLAIKRALKEAPHAPTCRSWRVIVPDMTRDELENGGAERRIFALETREKACTCFRRDLDAALDLVKGYPPAGSGTCRVCGCTENAPCTDLDAGMTCAWTDASQTLCTVCARALDLQQLSDEILWFLYSAMELGRMRLMPWSEWLVLVIGRLCRAGAGGWLYAAYDFLEKGLSPGSAESLYIEACGGPTGYLLGRLEAIARIANVALPESPAVAAAPDTNEATLPTEQERRAS